MMANSKLSEKYKEDWIKTKGRRISFLGRRIIVNKIIRTGTCSRCNRTVASGDIKQTQLHHLEYNNEDPLANTIELCVSCHVKESFRLGQSKGRGHKKTEVAV